MARRLLIVCFFKTCLWPRSVYRRSRRCWSWQKFMKIWQNVYEGLNFSRVKFYHDLYPLVLKIYWENLKISAITGRLPVHLYRNLTRIMKINCEKSCQHFCEFVKQRKKICLRYRYPTVGRTVKVPFSFTQVIRGDLTGYCQVMNTIIEKFVFWQYI